MHVYEGLRRDGWRGKGRRAPPQNQFDRAGFCGARDTAAKGLAPNKTDRIMGQAALKKHFKMFLIKQLKFALFVSINEPVRSSSGIINPEVFYSRQNTTELRLRNDATSCMQAKQTPLCPLRQQTAAEREHGNVTPN